MMLSFCAGSLTGSFAEVITNPPDQVKTMTQAGVYLGFVGQFLTRENNPPSFWKVLFRVRSTRFIAQGRRLGLPTQRVVWDQGHSLPKWRKDSGLGMSKCHFFKRDFPFQTERLKLAELRHFVRGYLGGVFKKFLFSPRTLGQ